MKDSTRTPPTAPFPPAPPHLTPLSRELWHEIGPIEATTPARRLLLLSALESLDRCEQARLVIAKEGLVTAPSASAKMVHCHPLLRVEVESRNQFQRAMGQLLDANKPKRIESPWEL